MNAARVWIRDILVIAACIVVLFVAWKAWQAYGAVKDGLTSISREINGATNFPTPDAPAPTLTGCPPPLAPTDCGG